MAGGTATFRTAQREFPVSDGPVALCHWVEARRNHRWSVQVVWEKFSAPSPCRGTAYPVLEFGWHPNYSWLPTWWWAHSFVPTRYGRKCDQIVVSKGKLLIIMWSRVKCLFPKYKNYFMMIVWALMSRGTPLRYILSVLYTCGKINWKILPAQRQCWSIRLGTLVANRCLGICIVAENHVGVRCSPHYSTVDVALSKRDFFSVQQCNALVVWV